MATKMATGLARIVEPRSWAATVGTVCAALALLVCWASSGASGAGILSPGNFAGRVSIHPGRRLYLACRGHGSPVVLLESGSGDSGREWLAHHRGLPAIMPAIARFTRVCIYDRPGTTWAGGLGQPKSIGRSDPVAMPRTARDIVLDLHALLHAAGRIHDTELRGPYVLAGFSFGGMIVRLYATTYPRDVAGLVSIDAQTEWFADAEKRLLTRAQYTNYLIYQPPTAGFEGYSHYERLDLDASSAQMRQAQADAPLRRLPAVVVSHSPTAPNPFGFPSSFPIRALNQAFNASQDKLAAVVHAAHHVIARRSGHAIGLNQPNLVIGAIRSVVDRARGH
jgi:pimeloyl-ACP methyl ester carboxylesterase